jgi:para-aminobenzoate synthetase component 1
MSFGSLQILSSSPERFFETDGQIIRTRPIKGTRPRGETPELDRALLRELSESEKDRAELTMIVDLLRNDLGRVCRLGSVRVEKLCEPETYENVFHQVATIRGELSEKIGAEDILRAVFPGGSITGAPKIRAMEIIEELEPVKRGMYTGSLGYLGFDGRMDLNIAIRTLVCFENRFYYQVGGGIVWDSDPDEEYDETLHKGRSIYRTLESFWGER